MGRRSAGSGKRLQNGSGFMFVESHQHNRLAQRLPALVNDAHRFGNAVQVAGMGAGGRFGGAFKPYPAIRAGLFVGSRFRTKVHALFLGGGVDVVQEPTQHRIRTLISGRHREQGLAQRHGIDSPVGLQHAHQLLEKILLPRRKPGLDFLQALDGKITRQGRHGMLLGKIKPKNSRLAHAKQSHMLLF